MPKSGLRLSKRWTDALKTTIFAFSSDHRGPCSECQFFPQPWGHSTPQSTIGFGQRVIIRSIKWLRDPPILSWHKMGGSILASLSLGVKWQTDHPTDTWSNRVRVLGMVMVMDRHCPRGVQDGCWIVKEGCWNCFCPCSLPCDCLLYTSPSPRDLSTSRMPSSA